MTRIPPSLSYLTIYNPTLRPSELFEDDEDAEEQAHILFYTSKDRAVSRDRMLRQVGLGKALVNFVEQFSAGDLCNNVHSQSRRMVMVSPERDFWIHTCIDVARIPSPPIKGTVKAKVDKGRADTATQYDYEDGSVHDGAVRARILRGYERFKLTHGSFASILSNLGQQALELQLERFWTVWAWSWDMEESPDFAETLVGPRLHPYFSSLIPLLDDFASNMSSNMAPIILSRKQIIPTSRFTEGRHPSALAAHLSSMIPAPSTGPDMINTLTASVETIRGTAADSTGSAKTTKPASSGGTFLGMPSMNVKMDMRKWNWPGYLTFGKGSSTKVSIENLASLSVNAASEKDKEEVSSFHKEQDHLSQVEVPVNVDNLHDAIASDSISISQGRAGLTGEEGKISPTPAQVNGLTVGNIPNDSISGEESRSMLRKGTPPLTPPLPVFSLTRLHLAACNNSTETRRVSIHYLVRNGYMLALLNTQEPAEVDSESRDLQYASENAMKLFDDIESTVYSLDFRVPNSPRLASTALERQDQLLIKTAQYSLTSISDFISNSSHLFNAKAILDSNPKVYEVFSRGQNPQHWHVAKRGLGGISSSLNNTSSNDEVFMEMFRKEASLTDVDNVLLGSVKKTGILDGYGNSSSK